MALTNSVLLLNCEQVNSADTAQQTTILRLIQETNAPLIISTEERLHSPQRPLITFDPTHIPHLQMSHYGLRGNRELENYSPPEESPLT